MLFLLVQALPGDAATAVAGRSGSEAVAAARAQMGLDRPVVQRYLEWLAGLPRGDLGQTFVSQQPVVSTITTPLLASLSLAGVVFAALILITVPVTVASGARRAHRASRSLAAGAAMVSAMPEFVVTIALLAFLAVWLRLLPVLSVPGAGRSVWENPICLVLPAIALWLVCSASIVRRGQALVAVYAQAAYVRDAVLAGLPWHRVMLVHLLPGVAPAFVQLLAQCVPYLLGGTVIIETVTSFPGLGYALVTAISSRESLVVMAIGSLLLVLTAVAFTLADLVARSQRRVVAVV